MNAASNRDDLPDVDGVQLQILPQRLRSRLFGHVGIALDLFHQPEKAFVGGVAGLNEEGLDGGSIVAASRGVNLRPSRMALPV